MGKKNYNWGIDVTKESDRKESQSGGGGVPSLPFGLKPLQIVWMIVFLILFVVIFSFLNNFIGQPLVVFAWLWGIDQGWVLISMLGITVILVVILYLVVLGSLRGGKKKRR